MSAEKQVAPYSPTAPQGYIYHNHLFADWKMREKYPFILLLLWANLIALIPLAIGIILLWLPYQFYLYLDTPYAIFPTLSFSLLGKVLLGGLIIFTSMIVHEWLHGVALQFMGYKPHYAFNKLYLLATIEDGEYLNRRDYLWMTLTPLIVITVGGGLLLFVLPPSMGKLLLIALLLNTAASIGDLMVAVRVYQSPQDAIFTDDNGIQVFYLNSENSHSG